MKVGIFPGSFDFLHFGYFHAFKEARKYCDKLIIALHSDPSVERTEKDKPYHTLHERWMMLSSITYIDEIITYSTEKELEHLVSDILKPDIYFLGDDYFQKDHACSNNHDIEFYYITREHDHSATKLKKYLKEIT